MKYSFQMGRLAIAGIIMAIAVLLTAPVSAKDPESYVSIKKDVYTNLAELYSKAGDQAKAEKFKNLAETL